MDDFTLGLLGLFTLFAYSGSVLFFWAIYKENCHAHNHPRSQGSRMGRGFGLESPSGDPIFRSYLSSQWKTLTLLGFLFLGLFAFFLNHVCHYT